MPATVTFIPMAAGAVTPTVVECEIEDLDQAVAGLAPPAARSHRLTVSLASQQNLSSNTGIWSFLRALEETADPGDAFTLNKSRPAAAVLNYRPAGSTASATLQLNLDEEGSITGAAITASGYVLVQAQQQPTQAWNAGKAAIMAVYDTMRSLWRDNR